MNTRLSPFVESGYRNLARFTSYTAWNHFQEWRRREWMEPGELHAFRLQRLQNILRHAYQHIPFYRDLWDAAAVNPMKVTAIEDLQEFPVVSKADLIVAQEKDAFGLSKRKDFEMTRTSGTTGPCMYLPFTRENLQQKYASYLREFYATGWRLGVASAALHYSGHLEFGGKYTGRPDHDNFVLIRKLAFRFAHRRVLLEPWPHDHYDGCSDLPHRWYRELRKHQPYLLESMDFNLLALYHYMRTNDLPRLKIPAMFVLATLAPELKQRLELFFDTQIFNRYGPHEIEGVAFECDRHEGLHMATDCVHAEFLDDNDQPVKVGASGHIVLTDFDSDVMPLIRYRIGDMGRQLDRSCSCGRSFPLMADIEGRTRDRLHHANGHSIPDTELTTVLQPLLCLFQVVQDQNNCVEFRLLPADKDRRIALEPAVTKAIKSVLGETISLRITTKKPLDLEPNGKFCFVKRGEFTP